MLSRSQAKTFFLGGTFVVSAVFIWLTVDSFKRIPEQTGSAAMSPQVIRGKHLWDEANCMGCHTLLGEGGYYAPELTDVYKRRGPAFIRAMILDPQGMYPGERRMYEYNFTSAQIEDLVAFFEWIGKMDLNGFPPKPVLFSVASSVASAGASSLVERTDRPMVFNQMCIACHALAGQGGTVGPALDGIGDRMSKSDIEVWLDAPQNVRPGTQMPDLPLSNEDMKELAAFLSTLRGAPGPSGDVPPGAAGTKTQGPDVPPVPSGSAPAAGESGIEADEAPIAGGDQEEDR